MATTTIITIRMRTIITMIQRRRRSRRLRRLQPHQHRNRRHTYHRRPSSQTIHRPLISPAPTPRNRSPPTMAANRTPKSCSPFRPGFPRTKSHRRPRRPSPTSRPPSPVPTTITSRSRPTTIIPASMRTARRPAVRSSFRILRSTGRSDILLPVATIRAKLTTARIQTSSCPVPATFRRRFRRSRSRLSCTITTIISSRLALRAAWMSRTTTGSSRRQWR